MTKDVVRKEIKKEERKVFTKKRSNSRIKKNHNPLKVNCKIYKRRDGLYKVNDKVLKEIEKDLNFRERIIVRIHKNTFKKVFNKTRIEIINKTLH